MIRIGETLASLKDLTNGQLFTATILEVRSEEWGAVTRSVQAVVNLGDLGQVLVHAFLEGAEWLDRLPRGDHVKVSLRVNLAGGLTIDKVSPCKDSSVRATRDPIPALEVVGELGAALEGAEAGTATGAALPSPMLRLMMDAAIGSESQERKRQALIEEFSDWVGNGRVA